MDWKSHTPSEVANMVLAMTVVGIIAFIFAGFVTSHWWFPRF